MKTVYEATRTEKARPAAATAEVSDAQLIRLTSEKANWTNRKLMVTVNERLQESQTFRLALVDSEVEHGRDGVALQKAILEAVEKQEEAPKQIVTVKEGKIVPAGKPVKSLHPVTAAELDQLEIKPIQWIVEGVLPTGLAMLGAPSKYYKSYMALDLCISACAGATFLGKKTNQCGCLYLDLESTPRRPQQRLRQILGEREKPKNLLVVTGQEEVARIGEGFEEQITQILEEHPDIRVVVVDVLQLIRPAARAKQSGYDRDYDDLRVLKHLADTRDICLLLIHHTRKMRDPGDVFNELSGSVGVMGTLDAALVISKEKRSDEGAVLHITGRDLESIELSIEFDKTSMRWKSNGTAEDVELQRQLQAYRSSHIIQTIRKLVKQGGGHWQGTAQQIKESSRFFQTPIAEDVRKIGRVIGDYEGLLWAEDKITFEYQRGSQSRKYSFKAV